MARTGPLGAAHPAAVFALVAVGILIPLQRFAWNRLLGGAGSGAAAGAGSVMLTHMLGIGLGAIFGALMLTASQNVKRLLARVVLGATVLTIGPIFLVGVLDWESPLQAALLVLPGAIGAGLVVPLVARGALSDRELIGKQAGTLLFLLASGWTLSLALVVPAALAALSAHAMILASAAVLLAAGTWLGFVGGMREWIAAGAVALMFVIGLLTPDSGASPSAHVGESQSLIIQRRGVMATYAVIEDGRSGERLLVRDGESFATQPIGDRMLAHLPLLLHPNAARVLVADCGNAIVAGAVAGYEEPNRIDCVDDEQPIFDIARAFAADNREALKKPSVHTHAAMLRPFLRVREDTYDVIVLAPRSPNGVAGALRYTDRFYAIASAALRSGGLFCQRLPADAWDLGSVRATVAAAAAEFGHASVWEFADGLVLLAGNKPPVLDSTAMMLRSARQAGDLEAARVGDTVHLLASRVCSAAAFASEGAAAFAGEQVDALADGQHGVVREDDGAALRTHIASCSESPAAWMKRADASLAGASARAQALRGLIAAGPSDAGSSGAGPFVTLSETAPRDLRVHGAAEDRLYDAFVATEDWARAARLTLVRDRGIALRGVAVSAEGTRRRYYNILSIRHGRDPDAEMLDRLAAELEGAERLYVENRARVLRGEEPQAGDARLPNVKLRDPTEALNASDEEALRALLLDAECGGMLKQFDKAVWAWWKSHDDPLAATLMLHSAGWRHSLRAARQIAGRNARADLVRLAPLFAAVYPADRTWERLCGNRHVEVRMAAAEAARAHGSTAHVAHLVDLCRDEQQAVRTGAFLSLEGIIGPAVATAGYDAAAPTPEALAKLEALAPPADGRAESQAAAPEQK